MVLFRVSTTETTVFDNTFKLFHKGHHYICIQKGKLSAWLSRLDLNCKIRFNIILTQMKSKTQISILFTLIQKC